METQGNLNTWKERRTTVMLDKYRIHIWSQHECGLDQVYYYSFCGAWPGETFLSDQAKPCYPFSSLLQTVQLPFFTSSLILDIYHPSPIQCIAPLLSFCPSVLPVHSLCLRQTHICFSMFWALCSQYRIYFVYLPNTIRGQCLYILDINNNTYSYKTW